MKGKSPDSSQTSFLMNGLCEQLNPRHSIYQLSKIIDWDSLEEDFTRLYRRKTRQEGHRHLQEDRQQRRYHLKTKLQPYCSRSAASGVQPEISQAKEKSSKSSPKNPDNRTRYGS